MCTVVVSYFYHTYYLYISNPQTQDIPKLMYILVTVTRVMTKKYNGHNKWGKHDKEVNKLKPNP